MPDIIQMNDFKDFSFKGQKASSFGITRVSSGNRYNENLNPTLKDTTVNITGRDGTVWFDSIHTQRQFKVDFAFDSLTETQLRELKKWLNGKDAGELIFDEEPYKAYTCKVTGNATIKYLCFDKTATERVYKGEGSINFTAYEPYAHMPTYSGSVLDTHYQSFWANFSNKAEWLPSLNLPQNNNSLTVGYLNQGDLSTPFKCSRRPVSMAVEPQTRMSGTIKVIIAKSYDSENHTYEEEIGHIQFQETQSLCAFSWDSETGIVKRCYQNTDPAVSSNWGYARYIGNSLVSIPCTNNTNGYKVFCQSGDSNPSTWPSNNSNITFNFEHNYLFY